MLFLTTSPTTTTTASLYYITHYKWTECVGFHEEPQCAAVCPADCCVPDPDMEETEEVLLEKKSWLHLE